MANTMTVVGLFGMFLVLGLAGCQDQKRALTKGLVSDTWSQVSDDQFIRTRGIGVAAPGAASDTHRKGLARNAGLVQARYELLSIVKGLRLSGGLTVGNLMQTDGQIKEMADRIVAGAEEEQVEFTRDGGCVVLLRLERDKVQSILAETAPYEHPARGDR